MHHHSIDHTRTLSTSSYHTSLAARSHQHVLVTHSSTLICIRTPWTAAPVGSMSCQSSCRDFQSHPASPLSCSLPSHLRPCACTHGRRALGCCNVACVIAMVGCSMELHILHRNAAGSQHQTRILSTSMTIGALGKVHNQLEWVRGTSTKTSGVPDLHHPGFRGSQARKVAASTPSAKLEASG